MTEVETEAEVRIVAGRRVICLIHPNPFADSVTFIRAHIERLPAQIIVLYGGSLPRYRDGDRPLLSQGLLHHLNRAMAKRIFGLPDNHFRKAALKRFLLTENVDAVLAEVAPVGVETIDICEDAGIPLLLFLRGADVYSAPIIERFGDRYPRLFEKARAIFVVSRHMERHLKTEYGISQQKLHYNPSGVDIRRFQGANPDLVPPIFLAVGRFVDKKAPYLTILAFKKVIAEISNARLVMIGEGPLLEACRNLARALSLGGAVEFLGAQPHGKVAAAMQLARAVVQHSITPSCGDTEGTPNSLKEAGASGLPVIATRHGGIPDIVIDGETGFLVNEGDVDGMAKYMTKLAKDPGLAARLGKAARDWICAEFSMEAHIEKLWQVIEATISDNSEGT